MKLDELDTFPELSNTIVIDGNVYVKKREPLSNEEIFLIGYKAGFSVDHDESADYKGDVYGFLNEDGHVDNEPYFKLVRAIEKAHGIGVDDE